MRNSLLGLSLLLSFQLWANDFSCPDNSTEVSKTMINEVFVDGESSWVEFYIPPNVTVNFDGWQLYANGNGNKRSDNTFEICDDGDDCIFSGGSTGVYVIFGDSDVEDELSPEPEYFIEADDSNKNNGLNLHNNWQELMLLDENGELVHYLRYFNNNHSDKFNYNDCPTEYSTHVEHQGAATVVCTSIDGEIKTGSTWPTWGASCGQTVGATNGPTVSSVDHYRIVHDTTGLTCRSSDITVKACADENCSSIVETNISGNVRKLFNGNTIEILAVNSATGIETSSFNHTSADTLTFEFINQNPSAASANVCENRATGQVSNCQMVLANSGYVLTVPDKITSSATDSHLATIQAVKKDDASQSCVPNYIGNQTVNINYEFAVPNALNVNVQQAIALSADNSSFSFLNYGTGGSNLELNFDNSNASASFYFKYQEAGEISLTASDVNGTILPATDNTKAIPHQLYYGFMTLADAAMPATFTAGNEFKFVIQAITNDATALITQNYLAGDVEFDLTMTNLGINANSRIYYSATQSLVSNLDNGWQDASLNFVGGIYNTDSAYSDDIGSVSFDIQDRNYLGYAIPSQGQSVITRFIPAYYQVNINAPTQLKINNSNETVADYVYIGRDMTYVVPPEFTVNAFTSKDNKANNLGGGAGSETLSLILNDFTGVTFVESNNYPGFNPTGDRTWSDLDDFDGDIILSLTNDVFEFPKTATPYTNTDSVIRLNLSQAFLTDIDGVGYCEIKSATCPNSYEQIDIDYDAVNLRYGRFQVENGFGPDNVHYKLMIKTQYWDGRQYVTNEDDSDSDFFSLTSEVTNNTSATEFVSYNLNASGNTFTDGLTTTTTGIFILEQDQAAELFIEFTNVPAWLNVDWDGDGVLENGADADDDKASATIILGRYRGNDRIIYKRER